MHDTKDSTMRHAIDSIADLFDSASVRIALGLCAFGFAPAVILTIVKVSLDASTGR